MLALYPIFVEKSSLRVRESELGYEFRSYDDPPRPLRAAAILVLLGDLLFWVFHGVGRHSKWKKPGTAEILRLRYAPAQNDEL
jgi:hypothetical protein